MEESHQRKNHAGRHIECSLIHGPILQGFHHNKDYRVDGHARQKVMRLATDEFIRRFLIHVLPTGFHRIRHYGLFASGVRAHNIAHARELLAAPIPREQNKRPNDGDQPEPRVLAHPSPCCGGRMIVIETFERGRAPRASSLGEIRIDTS
jgi:hypothetical protein